jgi:hypothetical protein
MTSINMAAIKRRPESRDDGQRCAKSGEGIIGATSKERLATNVYTSRSSAAMRHEDSRWPALNCLRVDCRASLPLVR